MPAFDARPPNRPEQCGRQAQRPQVRYSRKTKRMTSHCDDMVLRGGPGGGAPRRSTPYRWFVRRRHRVGVRWGRPSYWAKPSKSLLRRGEVAHPNVGRRRTTHAAASDAALGRRDRVAVGMLGHSAGELAGPYQELHGLSCGNRAKRPLRVTSATVRGDSANAVLRTCAGLRI